MKKYIISLILIFPLTLSAEEIKAPSNFLATDNEEWQEVLSTEIDTHFNNASLSNVLKAVSFSTGANIVLDNRILKNIENSKTVSQSYQVTAYYSITCKNFIWYLCTLFNLEAEWGFIGTEHDIPHHILLIPNNLITSIRPPPPVVKKK